MLTVASVLLRHPIAAGRRSPPLPGAAALGIPTGCVYLELSLLRGALQGVGDYRSVGVSLVGEQVARLIAGAVLALGLGVTGAYLGSIVSYLAMSAYCVVKLRAHAAAHPEQETAPPAISLGRHIWRAWAPIAGLAVIAVLQNIDLIAAKHRFSTSVATSYAATAVAAKVLIWVAMGAAFYLVPEVSRRRAEGQDTRPVLARAVGIVLVCAVPCLLIFAVGAHPLLTAVFTRKKATASDSLLVLALAFTILACTYLAIQYMLAHEANLVPDRHRRGGRRRAGAPASGLPAPEGLCHRRAGRPGRGRAGGLRVRPAPRAVVSRPQARRAPEPSRRRPVVAELV